MYVLQIVVCPFVFFLLAIVMSVLLRYTDSDYPFGILSSNSSYSNVSHNDISHFFLRLSFNIQCIFNIHVSSSDNKSVSHWIMFDYFFHV
jgi:hypothetical protein